MKYNEKEIEFYSNLIAEMKSPKTSKCGSNDECAQCRACPCGVIEDPDMEYYVSRKVDEFGGSDMLQWAEWGGYDDKHWMVLCPYDTLDEGMLKRLDPLAKGILGIPEEQLKDAPVDEPQGEIDEDPFTCDLGMP